MPTIKIEKPEEFSKFLGELKDQSDQNSAAIAELAGVIKEIAEYVVKTRGEPRKRFDRTWAQSNPITVKYFK